MCGETFITVGVLGLLDHKHLDAVRIPIVTTAGEYLPWYRDQAYVESLILVVPS